MALDSKIHDKIRIKKKAAPEKEAPPANCCQWDGCNRPATHRAPAGRMREGEFFMFCVDHVREYNKSYNYFSGLGDTEIAQFQKDALTGHRPTWQMGSNGQMKAAPHIAQVRSGRAGYYKKVGENPFGEGDAAVRARAMKPLERKALRTLGLNDNAEGEAIRARYTELVKQHHPDSNGGVRGSEERLQDVIQAYRLLKKAGHC
ncbi:MAG: DnaJ domain-containing protein [Phyllobacteriaceae bacterium]|nr:DnaJ domain-containing protein [Phyllobacteriaceae bacterium]